MPKRLYALTVSIIEGLMTEAFAKANPVISRTIEIRGDQTLQDLHLAIFDAFGREEEHMYEFQFGTGPHDRSGDRYVLPMEFHDPFDAGDQATGDLMVTTIDSLDLEVGRAFGYWFDFGDNWYHEIDVVAIGEVVPRRRYPRVTERVGESPPQYVDWDEEDE
ncbi:MAG: plasmid pRiA4b ORF-3 family protein [Armatimonadetes bacterium]|nr:plasmid pRiA4b ORF-3 family protein [Armatimonadota bacterium]